MIVQLNEKSFVFHFVSSSEGYPRTHTHTQATAPVKGKEGEPYGHGHWPFLESPARALSFSRSCPTCHSARSISTSISGCSSATLRFFPMSGVSRISSSGPGVSPSEVFSDEGVGGGFVGSGRGAAYMASRMGEGAMVGILFSTRNCTCWLPFMARQWDQARYAR